MISEFDTFVENWKNQGGDQILKEINEELNNSSGNWIIGRYEL